MRNEKAFTRVIRRMALRKGVYVYRRIFLNFKHIFSWIYWIIIIFYPIITKYIGADRSILESYIAEVIGITLAAVIIIFIEYIMTIMTIEEFKWCESEDW